MKIKEINVTANVAWSPIVVQPMYLACGTPSQQIDNSGSSKSILQLYNLGIENESLDMTLAVTKTVPAKFNQLIWHKSQNEDMGMIAGGCDNGSVYLYSPLKMLMDEDSLILSLEGKHLGPVHSLDINYHQLNLLASGSNDCEIFIWDINNPTSPMTPGTKSNASADVTGLQWNRQVEHIIASTFGGRCVVYDLRKSASIIQISESVSGIKAHNVQWHPDVATQLILGCEDDGTPVCQVWDLRFATAPLKLLEGHQRGIMATSWCPADPNLFITSAKDNKIYVWNPNVGGKTSAEIVGEFPSYNQWSFDVCWCPRDPSLVAASSVDGTVSVYSLLGAGLPPAQSSKFSAIADSFPGMEMPTEVPQAAQPQSIYLKYPPKWFAKKAGVSFGFGGRLLSWGGSSRIVEISQVVTEPLLVKRSTELEEALSHADFITYCQNKSENSPVTHEKVLWDFIGATFKPSARSEYMSLFKFYPDQVAVQVRPQDFIVTPQDLADKISDLGAIDEISLDPSEQFEMIASAQSIDKTPESSDADFEAISTESLSLSIGDDPEGLIRHALLLGDFESAVKLCLEEKKHSLALILASHAGVLLYSQTRDKILNCESHCGIAPLVGSIVRQDLGHLVTKCKLSEWKEALVAVLTYSSDDEYSPLAECLAERLEEEKSLDCLRSAVLCYLCAGNLEKFVSCWVKAKPAPDNNPSELQDLVEIIVVMERALLTSGKSRKLGEGSIAGIYLCHYASQLASQGALSTAVSYLSNATQGEMVDLRDRLYRALGYQTNKSLASNRNRSTSTSSQHSYRRTSTPFSPHQQTTSPSSFQPPAPTVAASPQAPQIGQKSFSSFSSPSQASVMSPSVYGHHSRMHQGQPPISPVQVSRPQVFVPQPPATQTFGAPPVPQAFKPLPPAAQTFGAPGPPAAQTFGAPGPPAAQTFGAPGPPAAQTFGALGPPAAQTFGAPVPQLFMPQPPAAQTFGSPPTGPPALSMMAHDPLAGQQDPNIPAPVPAAFDLSLPKGWNDPPALSARKAKQQHKSQPPGDVFQPAVMVPEQQQFQGFQTMVQTTQLQAQEIPPPAPKEPIPTEHQIIQTTFNKLRENGFQNVTNPSAKQRFQDIAVKLEVLYDKLRVGQISDRTLAGLHQIVAAIRNGDYHSALQIHSSIITSGNFTELSQFMPAIKILLNTCMQCQVFL